MQILLRLDLAECMRACLIAPLLQGAWPRKIPASFHRFMAHWASSAACDRYIWPAQMSTCLQEEKRTGGLPVVLTRHSGVLDPGADTHA